MKLLFFNWYNAFSNSVVGVNGFNEEEIEELTSLLHPHTLNKNTKENS